MFGGGLDELERQQQQDDQQLSTPAETTTPLLMTILPELLERDLGIITSAIGPWWAQDEIAQMVGKPPQLEDD